MKEKDNIKFLLMIDMIIGVVFIFIDIAIIINNHRITDLENRVEELENQSKEVHEYILNRIGG